MQENFKSIVQKDEKLGLYIVVDRGKTFYGNLSNAWLEIGEEREKVRPIDLTTKLVVCLPNLLVEKLKIQAGQELAGALSLIEHKQLTVPGDVKEAFEARQADIAHLSLPQQRQGLLFIAESTTPEIRQQRINALVQACLGRKK